jgi:alanine dehydrogenase
MQPKITVGLPRMHLEASEKREFLPEFIENLHSFGYQIMLENNYGAGMGFSEDNYKAAAPGLIFGELIEVYQQDIVVVLRYPGDKLVSSMRRGACLMSMLHYPTRPGRVHFLKDLGLEGISFDTIKDDVGRRMIENLRSVAWNGVEVAFQVLKQHYPPPGFEDPTRLPIKVTILGAGAVGTLAAQAAIRYGDEQTWRHMAKIGATGVQVTMLDYDVTNHPTIMQQILKYTDILVDATQRPDASIPVIPNDWIGLMRPYAVILDLSVDPYDCDGERISVKGIEGIPQGNLDQYVFEPDDPAYLKIPSCIVTTQKRTAISCYSWPGIYPKECMDIYGKQLTPLMKSIAECGGVKFISPDGDYFQRAVARGMLSRFE